MGVGAWTRGLFLTASYRMAENWNMVIGKTLKYQLAQSLCKRRYYDHHPLCLMIKMSVKEMD